MLLSMSWGWGVGWAWFCPVGFLATPVVLSGRFLSCRGGDTAVHCLVLWWALVSGLSLVSRADDDKDNDYDHQSHPHHSPSSPPHPRVDACFFSVERARDSAT